MAGLFGIGGSSAHTDRNQQLKSWGELNSLFDSSSKLGLEQVKEGGRGLSTASKYFSDIASGDTAKMSRALAPQISAIQGQTGQTVNQIGQFSGRSGGSAGAANEAGMEASRAIQNLFDLLGPEAMKEVASISGIQSELGQGELGLSENAAATTGGQSGDTRKTDQQLQQQQQAAVMEAMASLALA